MGDLAVSEGGGGGGGGRGGREEEEEEEEDVLSSANNECDVVKNLALSTRDSVDVQGVIPWHTIR